MKRMVSVALMLALLLSLAACGGTTDNPRTTDTPGGSEVVTQNPEQTGTGSGKTDAPSGGKLPSSGKTEESVETGPVPLQVLLGNHYEGEWSEDFTPLCNWTWSSIVLSDAAAEDFPELDANLREMNAGNYEYNMQRMYEMLPLAEEAAAEQEYFGGFTSNSEYLVQRADDRVLSIREDVSEYTGGIHPNYGAGGMNFDPATGLGLKLTDVLTDVENLPTTLTEKIRAKYTFEPFSGLREQLEEYAPDDYTWTLDYQGITFYFSPYEIAPYAAGLLTATIWFDEMPELFVEKYTETPEGGWAKMLPNANEVEVDLNRGDNERDSLYLSAYEDEYGSLDLYITRNDGQEQHLEECYGFTMKSLLVCLGEPGQERYFLYIEAAAENDYTTIYIYDLNGDEITLTGELSGAGFTGTWDEDVGEYGTWYEFVLNDPSLFDLSTTIQTLGTWVGYKSYTTDPQSGAILPLQEHYDLKGESPIVSAMDLEVTMLPSQKKETLPAGTSFYFLRTDGESYAELALEDSRECRIEIVYEDYTPMINGVPEYECFVNLMYAG